VALALAQSVHGIEELASSRGKALHPGASSRTSEPVQDLAKALPPRKNPQIGLRLHRGSTPPKNEKAEGSSFKS